MTGTDLGPTVDEILRDFHRGECPRDPYDDIAALVAEVERLRALRDGTEVWISPGRRSGEPCVIGTRIPTEQIARMVLHGTVADVLRDWDYLTRGQVLVACWFHATREGRGSRKWRERWGGWAQDYEEQLWRGAWDEIAEPPPLVAASSADHFGALGGQQ